MLLKSPGIQLNSILIQHRKEDIYFDTSLMAFYNIYLRLKKKNQETKNLCVCVCVCTEFGGRGIWTLYVKVDILVLSM